MGRRAPSRPVAAEAAARALRAPPGRRRGSPVEFDRSLHHRDVARPIEQHEPPVGKRRGELDAARRRRHPVLAHHDQRGHAHTRQHMSQIGLEQPGEAVGPPPMRLVPRDATCSTTWRGASGPNCVSATAPRRSVGLARTALRRRSTRSAVIAGQSRPHEIGDRAHRTTDELGRRRADEHDPGHRGRHQIGADLRHRERRDRAHAVPTITTCRSGATASSTAAMSRPIEAPTDRRPRSRSPRASLVHQHAPVVHGQVHPLLPPGGHVEAESVHEESSGDDGSPAARTARCVPSNERTGPRSSGGRSHSGASSSCSVRRRSTVRPTAPAAIAPAATLPAIKAVRFLVTAPPPFVVRRGTRAPIRATIS